MVHAVPPRLTIVSTLIFLMNQNIRLSKNRQVLLEEFSRAVRTHQNAQDAFDEAAIERLGINRSDGRASTSSTSTAG